MSINKENAENALTSLSTRREKLAEWRKAKGEHKVTGEKPQAIQNQNAQLNRRLTTSALPTPSRQSIGETSRKVVATSKKILETSRNQNNRRLTTSSLQTPSRLSNGNQIGSIGTQKSRRQSVSSSLLGIRSLQRPLETKQGNYSSTINKSRNSINNLKEKLDEAQRLSASGEEECAREIYRKISHGSLSRSVLSNASFWIAWAEFEEGHCNIERAIDILSEAGTIHQAKPSADIAAALKAITKRTIQKTQPIISPSASTIMEASELSKRVDNPNININNGIHVKSIPNNENLQTLDLNLNLSEKDSNFNISKSSDIIGLSPRNINKESSKLFKKAERVITPISHPVIPDKQEGNINIEKDLNKKKSISLLHSGPRRIKTPVRSQETAFIDGSHHAASLHYSPEGDALSRYLFASIDTPAPVKISNQDNNEPTSDVKPLVLDHVPGRVVVNKAESPFSEKKRLVVSDAALNVEGSVFVYSKIKARKSADYTNILSQSGSNMVVTPVRRSARHRHSSLQFDIKSLLSETGYCYAPNNALPNSVVASLHDVAAGGLLSPICLPNQKTKESNCFSGFLTSTAGNKRKHPDGNVDTGNVTFKSFSSVVNKKQSPSRDHTIPSDAIMNMRQPSSSPVDLNTYLSQQKRNFEANPLLLVDADSSEKIATRPRRLSRRLSRQ